VAGWIKRGPTGFIGTNKSCAAHTVDRLVDDYNAGRLREPSAKSLQQLIQTRRPEAVDLAGWRAIDAAEIARGGADRPRDKFIDVADMVTVASTAPKPTLRQRLLASFN
jgi:ferredoxin--NADP+ reductase